jgi:hypothetical protein
MSTKTKNIMTGAATTALVCLGLANVTNADPLPGEILKFQQLPLNNTVVGPAIYNGHDSPSTAYPFVNPQGIPGYQGFFFADDFADKVSTPVVHLKWWGSYIQNPNNTQVSQFLISFESDIPAPAGGFSMPGTPLLSQIVNAGPLSPASGTFNETLINGNVPEHLYQYNAELKLPFGEQKDTVYWVKIAALTGDTSMVWGWHNRDYTVQDTLASPVPVPGEGMIATSFGPYWHFQDDAVRGGMDFTSNAAGAILLNQYGMQPTTYLDNVDGPQGIGILSQDMAFELYTVIPEPASVALFGLAGALILLQRRR